MTDCLSIGILFGAGQSISSKKKYALKILSTKVFAEAESYYSNGKCGTDGLLELTTSLVKILEDSEDTNAGTGSELTINGTVECDASIMLVRENKKVFASVGAVSGIRNPIELGKFLLSAQIDPNSKFKPRTVPNFMVGDGAFQYAKRLGLCEEPPANLVTERAQISYLKWKENLDIETDTHEYTDTIGIIVIFGSEICVGSSSGGSLLKDPGRLGPAAIAGSGFDVNNSKAAVCSGYGEDITSMRLASLATNSDEELDDILRRSGGKIYSQRPLEYGCLRADICAEGVLFEWQHSTTSMACATAHFSKNKADSKTFFSDAPGGGGIKYNNKN